MLLVLLPFHALGVTVLTRIVAGPMHAPLSALALWKEVLLVVILLLALIEIIRNYLLTANRYSFHLDRLDWCIVILACALLSASFFANAPLTQVLYGIRYDLVPLVAFFVLRRVSWSEAFLKTLPIVLACAVAVAVVYALATLLLPDSFFSALGYSDLHSLYLPNRPIAAFQQIGGTALRRLQGPMSGPNQFGIWLACMLPILLALPARKRRVVAPLVLLAILLTFSRAAWIAAAVVLLVIFWPHLKKLSVTTSTILCIGVLTIALSLLSLFPSIILRVESSVDHFRNPMEAVAIMATAPLGRGLGSAGSANNRIADACVYLVEGSDASWAVSHPDVCVFVGEKQVQPTDACTCPLLPENWYLQLGVEGGWVAFLSFLALTFFMLTALRAAQSPLFLSFLVVSIAALALHAWEDAAVAYTVWILCAVTLAGHSTVPVTLSRSPDHLAFDLHPGRSR